MSKHSNRFEEEDFKDLLKQYKALKSGNNGFYLEEEAFEAIINHFEDRDKLREAFEAVNIAMSRFPFSGALMLKKADLLLMNQQNEAALALLEKAALFCPGDIMLFVLKTDALLALDEVEAAHSLLNEAVLLFEGDERVDLLLELSGVFDDYEEFEKLFDCLALVLQTEPCHEEALMKICFWADFTGRFDESITIHRQILEDFPFCELAWFNMAAAFQGLKLYEKAIDAYKYAVAIDDTFDIAYRNIADAFIKLRQYPEAIEHLERVMELCPPEGLIYEAIGHCYHKLSDFEMARVNYRKAGALNPDDSHIYYKIALTHQKEGNLELAIRQLEVAMRHHRLQNEYNLLMGECKMEQGKIVDAIHFFSNVVKVRPRNFAGRQALILCLLKANFLDEALVQCQQGLKLSNGNALFDFYAAAASFMMGKSMEAMNYLGKGLKKKPKAFRKILALVPGLLQNAQVLALVSQHDKTSAAGRKQRNGKQANRS